MASPSCSSQVYDLSELERLNTPDLIAYLQAEFQSAYFKKVEEILVTREEKLNLEKAAADELRRELRVSQDRCSELRSAVSKLETKNRDLEVLKRREEDEIAFQKKRYEELVSRVTVLEKEVSDLTLVSEKSTVGFGLLEDETQLFQGSGGGGGQDGGAPIENLDKSLTNIKIERTLSSSTKLNTGRSPENIIDIIDSENESEENSKENFSNNIVKTLKRRRIVFDSDDEDEAAEGDVNLMDSRESNDDFSKLISGIRRWKSSEKKWQYEIDMINSFDADSRLCMRAVCALYRHHTFEERGVGGSLHSGYQVLDKQSVRLSVLGKFLLDGGHEGEMKKSDKELEMFDPNGVKDCRWLAKHYSKQLFTIYQNKEDPFFP